MRFLCKLSLCLNFVFYFTIYYNKVFFLFVFNTTGTAAEIMKLTLSHTHPNMEYSVVIAQPLPCLNDKAVILTLLCYTVGIFTNFPSWLQITLLIFLVLLTVEPKVYVHSYSTLNAILLFHENMKGVVRLGNSSLTNQADNCVCVANKPNCPHQGK